MFCLIRIFLFSFFFFSCFDESIKKDQKKDSYNNRSYMELDDDSILLYRYWMGKMYIKDSINDEKITFYIEKKGEDYLISLYEWGMEDGKLKRFFRKGRYRKDLSKGGFSYLGDKKYMVPSFIGKICSKSSITLSWGSKKVDFIVDRESRNLFSRLTKLSKGIKDLQLSWLNKLERLKKLLAFLASLIILFMNI